MIDIIQHIANTHPRLFMNFISCFIPIAHNQQAINLSILIFNFIFY
jgi:hypothetical protein